MDVIFGSALAVIGYAIKYFVAKFQQMEDKLDDTAQKCAIVDEKLDLILDIMDKRHGQTR
jgi:hypothetical protein